MKKKNQAGFTMIEMMVSVTILVIVMSTAFELLNSIQTRKRTEEMRVDILEESRDFVDEMARDLRNAGYPNLRMYSGCVNGGACVLTPAATPLKSSSVAAGLVEVSATDILFEGDVNQDGTVDTVRYQLQAGAGGNCPCSLFRSQLGKTNGVLPKDQGNSFNVQVDNVINSAGGVNAYALSGTTKWGATNDAAYTTYKAAPVFAFFDANNNAITVPADLSTAANQTAGQNAAVNVRLVVITLNVLAPNGDMVSGTRPAVSTHTTVRITNF